jgi:hypothetical protein
LLFSKEEETLPCLCLPFGKKNGGEREKKNERKLIFFKQDGQVQF